MVARIFNQTMLSNRIVARVCQFLCSAVAALVLISGILRIEEMDLNEVQLFSALNGILVLTGVFVVLAFLSDSWARQRGA